MKKHKIHSLSTIISNTFCAAFVFSFALIFYLNTISLIKPDSASIQKATPSLSQEALLNQMLDSFYVEERTAVIKDLPYSTTPLDLDIASGSAILIDTQTGNILYEKNADERIPPASMTKLVEMYVVFKAIEDGEVSLTDIVPLPPECWAVNLPRDASLMFLAQGQIVTLDELLLGLSIASGNDASVAVALYVAGSMEKFVERMNSTIESLGLKNTHFVESSGYSELNYTTARDFAEFTRIYISKFPWALEKYHAQKMIQYPMEKNLPSYQKNQGNSQAITQYNTNKLLNSLEGCDGLKTGFIFESGYNITVTAIRDGVRYLCVLMKGPGNNTAEGNRYRVQDGTTLIETAFSTFYPFIDEEPEEFYIIPSIGTKEKCITAKRAYDASFSVPYITGNSPKETAENLHKEIQLIPYKKYQCHAGDPVGYMYIKSGNITLNAVPIISCTNTSNTSKLERIKTKIQEIIIQSIL